MAPGIRITYFRAGSGERRPEKLHPRGGQGEKAPSRPATISNPCNKISVDPD
jgi:hypothetical protein